MKDKLFSLAKIALIGVIVVICLSFNGSRNNDYYYSNEMGFDGVMSDSLSVEFNSFESTVSSSKNNGYSESAMLSYDNSVEIRCKDVFETGDSIKSILEDYNAYAESENLDEYWGRIKVKVPVDNREQLIENLENNYKVISKSEQVTDISDSVVSTEERIYLIENRIKRLESYMESAYNTSDLIELDFEIYDLESELRRLYSSLENKVDSVVYADLYIDLSEGVSLGAVFSDYFEYYFEDTVEMLVNFGFMMIFATPIILIGVVLFTFIMKFKNFMFRITNKKVKSDELKKPEVSDTKSV